MSLPPDREVSEFRPPSGAGDGRRGPMNEVVPVISTSAGRDVSFGSSGSALTPEARRIGDDMMMKGMAFAPILPESNSLASVFGNPTQQADKMMVSAMLAEYAAQGKNFPPELVSMAQQLGILKPASADAGQPGGGAERQERRSRPAHGQTDGGERPEGGERRPRGHARHNDGDGERHSRGHGRRRHGGGHGHHRRHGRDHGHHGGGHGRRHGGRRQEVDEDGNPIESPDKGSENPRGERIGDGGERRKPEGERREPGTERGGAEPKTAQERTQKIMSFLTHDLHLSKAQAAGVMGNLIQEAGPNLEPTKPGDGGHAYGIAQWNGARKRDLFNYAREHGGSPGSLDMQLQFLKHELTEGKEQRAYAKLLRTNTPEQAALSFSRHFERPGTPMNGNRIANARRVYRQYGDTELASE